MLTILIRIALNYKLPIYECIWTVHMVSLTGMLYTFIIFHDIIAFTTEQGKSVKKLFSNTFILLKVLNENYPRIRMRYLVFLSEDMDYDPCFILYKNCLFEWGLPPFKVCQKKFNHPFMVIFFNRKLRKMFHIVCVCRYSCKASNRELRGARFFLLLYIYF